MAVATNAQLIAGLYVAVFNRAPDPSGLAFWENAFTGDATIYNLAEGFAAHPVFASTYGGMSNAQFVASIYQKVLGAGGDADGLAYWTAKADSGISRADIVAEFVNDSLTVDLSSFTNLTTAELAVAQNRQDALTNKVDVGLTFAATFGANGNLNPATDTTTQAGLESDTAYLAAQAAIANVTASAASVTAAKANITAALATSTPGQTLIGVTVPVVTPTPTPTPGNPGGPVDTTGKILTLTSGDDTFTPTSVVETSRTTAFSDLIIARNGTLSSNDTINGGGGNDTLLVTLGASPAPILPSLLAVSPPTPKLSNVEAVVVQTLQSSQLDLSASTGINVLQVVGSTGYTDIYGTGSIATLSVRDQQKGVWFYDSTATKLGLDVDGFGDLSGDAGFVFIESSDIETLKIEAKESNLWVSGASTVEAITINASGSNKINLSTSSALESVIVRSTGSVDLTISSQLKQGAEIDVGGGSSLTFQTGITNGNSAFVSELGDNSIVTFAQPQSGTTHTSATTGTLSLALAGNGVSDVINLVLNSGYYEDNDSTTTLTSMTTIVEAAGIETVNVTSTGSAFNSATSGNSDGVVNTLTLTDNALETLNISGNQAFNFKSAATQASLETIDASSNTAGVSIDASAQTNSLAILGSSKADLIIGGAGADTLTGRGGADKFVFTSAEASRGALSVSDSSALNIDHITDFVSGTDKIQLGVGEAGFDNGNVTFDSATTVFGMASFSVTANNFTDLFSAIGTTVGTTGVSSASSAVIYDVIVSAGDLMGRYAIVLDSTAGVDVNDTIINISGATGLVSTDFSFVGVAVV